MDIIKQGAEVRLAEGYQDCGKCNVLRSFIDTTKPGEIGKVISISSRNSINVRFGSHVKGNRNPNGTVGSGQSICVDHLEVKLNPMRILFDCEPFKTMRSEFCKQHHINTVL